MRAFFGITLVMIGLAAVLLFGLGQVFALDDSQTQLRQQVWLAVFLILGGEVMAIGGSALVSERRPGRYDRLGKWLFLSGFVATCILIVAGLLNVFNLKLSFVSLLLMVAGGVGAFVSASSAVRDER
jgi:hypothetical protein